MIIASFYSSRGFYLFFWPQDLCGVAAPLFARTSLPSARLELYFFSNNEHHKEMIFEIEHFRLQT